MPSCSGNAEDKVCNKCTFTLFYIHREQGFVRTKDRKEHPFMTLAVGTVSSQITNFQIHLILLPQPLMRAYLKISYYIDNL
jgi:hypothetical protein